MPLLENNKKRKISNNYINSKLLSNTVPTTEEI